MQTEQGLSNNLFDKTAKVVIPESQWKRGLIEQDIKLSNLKMQMIELKSQSQMHELQYLVDDLKEQNKQLKFQKESIEAQKQKQIQELSLKVRELEQQLISTNMEIANVKSQLQIEQGLVFKLRKESDAIGHHDTTFSQPNNSDNYKGKSTFLNMFNFTGPKVIVQSPYSIGNGICLDQSIDYVAYLLEIQEDKNTIHEETSKQNILNNVPKQVINLSDLKFDNENVIGEEQKQGISPNQLRPKTMDKQRPPHLKQGNGYKITPDMKQDILQILLKKLPESEKQLNIKKWVDTYLPQIQLNGVRSMLDNSNFKKDLKRGIPAEVRGEVWSQFIGNALRITPNLYESLLNRVRIAEANIENDLPFKKNIDVIEKDLHRTFSDLGHFRHGGILYNPLKNLLAAFSMFRTDLGYVQGMSYVAATLILHLGDEYSAFSAFANVMHKYLLFTFYSFDMPKVNVFFHIYMRLMKIHIPKLYQMFTDVGFQCSVFLFEWTVAVFSNIVPLQISARIWDSWLFFDEYFFMKLILAVSSALKDQLVDGAFEKIITLFKSMSQFVSEEMIFQKLEDSKFTEKEYDKVRTQVLAVNDLERII